MSIQLAHVAFNVKVPSTQSGNSSLCILFDFFKLLSESSNLDLGLFVFIFKLGQLMEKLLALSLTRVVIFHVRLKALEDLHLHEFFETLYRLRFCLQLDIGLLSNNKVVLRKFLLVGIQLFFEEGHLAFCM